MFGDTRYVNEYKEKSTACGVHKKTLWIHQLKYPTKLLW